MENIVAALDFGTTKIAAIVGQKTDSGIRIVGYHEVPADGIVRGEVINVQRVVKSVESAIANVAKQVETPIREVWVNHCCERLRQETTVIKKRRTEDDWITEEEVEAILNEARNTRVATSDVVLQAIPQSYNVDDRIGEIDPVGMMGSEIEADIKLFIGKKSAIGASTMALSRNNLQEGGSLLRGIASARATLSENEKELGVALLDIGAGSSDLVVIKDNIIRHLSIIPCGGNAITEDIRQLCGIPLKTSEELKKQFGSAFAPMDNGKRIISIPGTGGTSTKEIPSKELAQIIQARLSEIIKTADHEIQQTGLKDELKAGLVITGGVASTMHIQRLATQLTGLGIRVAWPDNFVLAESVEKALTPGGSSAVGLILYAFDQLGDNIPNFEDPQLPADSEQGTQGTLFDKEDSNLSEGSKDTTNPGQKPAKKPWYDIRKNLGKNIKNLREMDIFDNNNDNEA